MSYLYQALPVSSNCIRVLEVYPDSLETPHTGHEIHGKLSVVNLADDPAPQFTALSYVWGVYAPEPHHVRCGTSRIKITPNGFEALGNLSRKFGNNKFVIWIDAVCINQEDEEEKMRQISLMGDIYFKAATTYIWLGEGTLATDRAMKYLNAAGFLKFFKSRDGTVQPRLWRAALSALLARFSLTRHPYPLKMTGPRDFEFIGQSGKYLLQVPSYAIESKIPPLTLLLRVTPVKYPSCQDLVELFSRTWISRIWTYQEAILSSNPVVICGDYQITWQRLSRSLEFLESVMFEPRDKLNSWRCVSISRDLLHTSRSPSEDAVRSEAGAYIQFLSELHDFIIVACLIQRFFLFLLILLVFCSLVLLGIESAFIRGFLISLLILSFCIMYMLPIRGSDMCRRDSEGEKWTKTSRADRDIPIEDCFLLGSIHREASKPIDAVLGMWGVLQLIGHPMKISGTTTDTHDLFRTFSLQMIKSTGSLSPLLMAAMHGCSDQPSWVADWSAVKRSDWKSYVEYRLSSRSARWLIGDVPTPFTIDNESGILHIYTKSSNPTFHIARLQSFLRVNTVYNEQENEAHLHNIKCLVAGLHDSFNNPLHEDLTRDIQERVTKPDYKNWCDFIKSFPQHSSLSYLNGEYIKSRFKPRRFRRLWNTHVTICNWLVTQGKLVYNTDVSGPESVKSRGLCCHNAKVGDLIIDAIGLPISIVVRKLSEEDEHHVRIIGLATDDRWMRPRTWESSEPITRFYIH